MTTPTFDFATIPGIDTRGMIHSVVQDLCAEDWHQIFAENPSLAAEFTPEQRAWLKAAPKDAS